MVGEGKLHCIFKPANLNFLLVYNHQYTESSTLLHKHTLLQYVYHTATSVVVMTISGNPWAENWSMYNLRQDDIIHALLPSPRNHENT